MLEPQVGSEWEKFLASIAPYMARALAILRHSSLDLPILIEKRGDELRKSLEDVRIRSNLCVPLEGGD